MTKTPKASPTKARAGRAETAPVSAKLTGAKAGRPKPTKKALLLKRLRCRWGVESKLMIEGESAPCGETLLRNIALGHPFLAKVKFGQSTQLIAGEQGLSRRRVQQILESAFL